MSLTRWHTLPSARAFLPRLALRGYFYIYIYIVDQTCVDDRARRSVYPIAKRKKKKKKRKERKEEKGKTSGGSRRIRSKDLSALSSLGLPSISRWSIFIYNSLRVYIYMIHLDATKINAWPSGSIMRDLWFLTRISLHHPRADTLTATSEKWLGRRGRRGFYFHTRSDRHFLDIFSASDWFFRFNYSLPLSPA